MWKLSGRCSYRHSEVGEERGVGYKANFCSNYSAALASFITWCFLCDIEIDVLKNYKLTKFINRITLTLQHRKYISKFLLNEGNHNLPHILIDTFFSSKKVKIPSFGTDQQNVQIKTNERLYRSATKARKQDITG